MNVEIRQAESCDIAEITRLFYETIQAVNSRDYSQEEIDDWSSWHTDYDRWNETIIEQNNREIYSEVSITAKTFFEKRGFCVKQKQLKKSRDRELEMENGELKMWRFLIFMAKSNFQRSILNGISFKPNTLKCSRVLISIFNRILTTGCVSVSKR